MQSRFDFLDGQYPKLAGYGKKAEECLNTDNNICLLNLGRIGETVTELLCHRNHIDGSTDISELLRLGVIDDDIARKITALTQIKDDAVNDEYSSEMAASRLLTTAHEVSEWFASTQGRSRFEFLADLFPPTEALPPLADLADFGREAEENLYRNTRYCFICLGDIGEAVIDTLMHIRHMNIYGKDQLDRINILASRGVISREQKDTLHTLRIARNKAIHQHYASDYDGRRLLEESLPLCEWLFRLIMSPGDIVRGYIGRVNEDSLTVNIGNIHGTVMRSEIPIDDDAEIIDCYREGERRIFKVLEADNDDISLSISQVHNDPWINTARRYAKYETGQEVKATVKRITSAFGAFVELRDGLEARVPESEYSIKDKSGFLKLGQEVLARVKWFNPKQYPYMLLSIKDAETDGLDEHEERLTEQPYLFYRTKHKKKVSKKKALRDKSFLELCKTAEPKKITAAINKGADVHAENRKGMTPLMMSALYNKNPDVIHALIDAGADINAQNNNGNTALIFAAMANTPEVVEALCGRGADIEITNYEKKTALNYSRRNKKLTDDVIKMLEGHEVNEALNEPVEQLTSGELDTELTEHVPSDEPEPEAHDVSEPLPSEPEQDTSSQPEQEQEPSYTKEPDTQSEQEEEPNMIEQEHDDYENEPEEVITDEMRKEQEYAFRLTLQKDFLRICRSGTDEEINEAINAGVNINVANRNYSTALMFAAQSNSADVVEILLRAGAYLDVQDIHGNTALIYAASYNTDDVVEVLLNAGADVTIRNDKGFSASDYARMNYRLADTNAMNRLTEHN